jgi:hypothetical protein
LPPRAPHPAAEKPLAHLKPLDRSSRGGNPAPAAPELPQQALLHKDIVEIAQDFLKFL